MKRIGQLIEAIAAPDNLRLAFQWLQHHLRTWQRGLETIEPGGIGAGRKRNLP